jgi:hypothetical protein
MMMMTIRNKISIHHNLKVIKLVLLGSKAISFSTILLVHYENMGNSHIRLDVILNERRHKY